jgi:serine/threonine protein phosphatase PrpC
MTDRAGGGIETPALDISGASHVGGRDDNQDRFAIIDGRVGVLADGMGGYAGGALAAELTVQAVTERLAALDRVAERDI